MVEHTEVHKAHTQVKDITDALVIREGDLTLVTQQDGDIPIEENHGYGLYHRDCRFLSGCVLKVNGNSPILILSSDAEGFASVTMLSNPSYVESSGRVIEKNTISIRRDRAIPGLVDEAITIRNFNVSSVSMDLSLEFVSDFDDIFTVRGITTVTEGRLFPPKYDNKCITLSYLGKDKHTRNTRVEFDPAPASVEGGKVLFNIGMKPQEVYSISVRMFAEDILPGTAAIPGAGSIDNKVKGIRASYADTMECCSNVKTDNGIFNKVFLRSLSDLRTLYMGMPVNIYYSAGVPWYDALFGRDSLISALQVIPYNPEVARSTLRVLASYQGTKLDDERDEQPGKILHELRVGEDANLNLVPYTPYYGSVDSTILFLILLAEYIDWTGNMQLFHDLLKNVDAAVSWLDNYTDLDGSGFISYTSYSTTGLYNQGWKDSWDSIMHADGRLAVHPIALAEVQGYAYMAKRRIARLYDLIGRHDDAARLKRDAVNLRWNFNEKFWMPDKKYYAQALDKAGVCDVVSSNGAQPLWSEIILEERAGGIVSRVFEEDMYSGWGIRTLSSKEKRFNPLGYHDGTVWPHDNALIAMGFCKYGFKEELLRLFTGMYEAAAFYPRYRLPELFAGFHREKSDVPIKYPVACSPQAWSAASIPYMLTAALGLFPDALNRKLVLYKPSLPPWLKKVSVNKLIVGNASTELEFERIGESTLVNVVQKRGDLEVDVVY